MLGVTTHPTSQEGNGRASYPATARFRAANRPGNRTGLAVSAHGRAGFRRCSRTRLPATGRWNGCAGSGSHYMNAWTRGRTPCSNWPTRSAGADHAVTSLVQLCQEPEFTRGHGALYDALSAGRIDDERFFSLLASELPQAVDGPEARAWIAEHDVIDHGLLGKVLAGLPADDAAQVRDVCARWARLRFAVDATAYPRPGMRGAPRAGARPQRRLPLPGLVQDRARLGIPAHRGHRAPAHRVGRPGRRDVYRARDPDSADDRAGEERAAPPARRRARIFMSIAEQMGLTLQNTAYSVNIKERLDFSCAVFDARGRASSPTRRTCRCIWARWTVRSRRSSATTRARIRAGDVFALNAPYNGGTHLPDITVCTPVFDDGGRDDSVLGRLARPSRRHRRHRAGLDEPARDHDRRGRRLYRQFPAGRARPLSRARAARAADRRPLAGAQSGPERQRPEGADRRQRQGRRANLRRMVEAFSLDTVEAYMGHVQDNAEESVRRVDRPARRQRVRGRSPTRARSSRSGSRSTAPPRGDRRLHRNLAAAAEQFQRAGAGHARRGALRLPRDGRRRDPDERRLPEADPDRSCPKARC